MNEVVVTYLRIPNPGAEIRKVGIGSADVLIELPDVALLLIQLSRMAPEIFGLSLGERSLRVFSNRSCGIAASAAATSW